MLQKTPKTRATNITIGRLYNLGNYEHVRYELTVEIPEGRSAAAALTNVMKVLAGCKPIKLSYSEQSIRHLAKSPEPKLSDPPTAEERQTHAQWKEARILAVKLEAALKRRAAALELLDEMGGTSIYKDAKLDWDDEEF
jgi:hypothetical protein